MCEKEYNLLRHFDLEAAKRGEAITCNALGTILHYVAGPDVDITVCVKSEGGQFCLYKTEKLRMAPLCWVEGKPVYKGDVLYYKQGAAVKRGRGDDVAGKPRTASGFENDRIVWPDGNCSLQSNLTWTPPKIKREGWINIYETYQSNDKTLTSSSYIYPTRKDADDAAVCRSPRTACIHIEWEE